MQALQEGRKVLIYVWPNGDWIYEWEQHSFLIQHSILEVSGGRYINLENIWSQAPFTDGELAAITAALGE